MASSVSDILNYYVRKIIKRKKDFPQAERKLDGNITCAMSEDATVRQSSEKIASLQPASVGKRRLSASASTLVPDKGSSTKREKVNSASEKIATVNTSLSQAQNAGKRPLQQEAQEQEIATVKKVVATEGENKAANTSLSQAQNSGKRPLQQEAQEQKIATVKKVVATEGENKAATKKRRKKYVYASKKKYSSQTVDILTKVIIDSTLQNNGETLTIVSNTGEKYHNFPKLHSKLRTQAAYDKYTALMKEKNFKSVSRSCFFYIYKTLTFNENPAENSKQLLFAVIDKIVEKLKN